MKNEQPQISLRAVFAAPILILATQGYWLAALGLLAVGVLLLVPLEARK